MTVTINIGKLNKDTSVVHSLNKNTISDSSNGYNILLC